MDRIIIIACYKCIFGKENKTKNTHFIFNQNWRCNHNFLHNNNPLAQYQIDQNMFEKKKKSKRFKNKVKLPQQSQNGTKMVQNATNTKAQRPHNDNSTFEHKNNQKSQEKKNHQKVWLISFIAPYHQSVWTSAPISRHLSKTSKRNSQKAKEQKTKTKPINK